MSDVGLSRRVKMFAVAETTAGTLVFPSASDYIIPVGVPTINQTPSFTDSEEIQDSLDVMDQFQNVLPPVEWSLNMYARPSGTIGTAPQGSPLFISLQGSENAHTLASLSATLSTTGVSLTFSGRSGGYIPHCGTLIVGSEQIYYDQLSMLTPSATTGTISGLSRGYNSTVATNYASNATFSVSCVYYKQISSDTPSFSLWIETDHFVQGAAGCTVNDASLDLTNEGAVQWNFSGQGMTRVWAGTDALQTNATSGVTTQITVEDADRFRAGAYIYNVTQNDFLTTQGYLISSVNCTTNICTLASPVGSNWATDDVIAGYLPTGTEIGTVIEAKDTAVEMDGVSAKFRTSTLNFTTPKQYLVDEVGTTAPEDYVEDKRSLSSTLKVYFRKEDAKYFNESLNSKEITLGLVFGDTGGYKMGIFFPRAKIGGPTISGDGPTMALDMDMTMLGTSGEDSCDIVFI